MPAMRCNRASLMQTKIHQFSTMEASLTLNMGNRKHIIDPVSLILPASIIVKRQMGKCTQSHLHKSMPSNQHKYHVLN